MDGRIVRCGIMPISCHFQDCKTLLVLSPSHVRSAIASTGLYLTFTLWRNFRRRRLSLHTINLGTSRTRIVRIGTHHRSCRPMLISRMRSWVGFIACTQHTACFQASVMSRDESTVCTECVDNVTDKDVGPTSIKQATDHIPSDCARSPMWCPLTLSPMIRLGLRKLSSCRPTLSSVHCFVLLAREKNDRKCRMQDQIALQVNM